MLNKFIEKIKNLILKEQLVSEKTTVLIHKNGILFNVGIVESSNKSNLLENIYSGKNYLGTDVDTLNSIETEDVIILNSL